MNTEYQDAIKSLVKRRQELKPTVEKVRQYSAGSGPCNVSPNAARAYRAATEEYMIIEHAILNLCEQMFPTNST